MGRAVATVCVMLTAWSSNVVSTVTLITLASVFAYMTPQACWSLLQDIVPSGRIGTAGGFVHLLANLAGILSPGITGFLIQYGGGYHTAFVLASLLALAGMLLLALRMREKAWHRCRHWRRNKS